MKRRATRKTELDWCGQTNYAQIHVALCTNEAGLHKALSHLKIPRKDWPDFQPTDESDASTHHCTHPSGKRVCIVCIGGGSRERHGVGVTGMQVVPLLTHEAVHIWQRECDLIGENAPGREIEAYSIQAIAQNLMYAYARLKGLRVR